MTKLIEGFLIILLIPFIFIIYFEYLKNKYSKPYKKNIDGGTVANDIKENDSVYVIKSNGMFSDDYNVSRKVLKLSENNYNGESIFAIFYSAYLASFYTYTKIFAFKKMFDKTIKFLNILAFILFIIGICIRENALLSLAIVLNVISLIYYVYLIIMGKDVIEITYNNLKKEKIIKNDEYLFLLKKMPLINLTKILTNLFDIGGLL